MGGTVKMGRFELEARGLSAGVAAAQDEAPDDAQEEAHEEAHEAAPASSKDPDALRTRLARKFTTLADAVTEGFAEFRIGAGSFGVELTAPEGMSTAGGKQRLQHMRLRPRRPGYPTLIGGSVDAESRYAELRDYAYLEITYALRSKKSVEVTPAEWEQFLRKAEVELDRHGIETVRVGPTKELLAQYKATRPISRPLIAAFAAVVVATSVVVWRVIVALAH
jgi:hypothetical protein